MNNKLGIIITFSYTTNPQQQQQKTEKNEKRMILKNGNFIIQKIYNFKKKCSFDRLGNII